MSSTNIGTPSKPSYYKRWPKKSVYLVNELNKASYKEDVKKSTLKRVDILK